MRSNRFIIISILPFLIVLVAFLAIPLVYLITGSLTGNGGEGWTLLQFKEVLTNIYYLKAIQNSLMISLFSSLIGIVVGFIITYALTKTSEKTQERILVFTNLTSNFAGIPLAFAFILLFGNSGLFTALLANMGIDLFQYFNLYSWTGLVFIYIYFQLPLSILLLFPLFRGLDVKLRDAAVLLGANRLHFWRYIGLPYLFPGLVGTLSLLFANSLGAYATAYALVGSNYNLVPIRIGGLVSGDIFARPELGSALAVILALILVVTITINEWVMKKVRSDLK